MAGVSGYRSGRTLSASVKLPVRVPKAILKGPPLRSSARWRTETEPNRAESGVDGGGKGRSGKRQVSRPERASEKRRRASVRERKEEKGQGIRFCARVALKGHAFTGRDFDPFAV